MSSARTIDSDLPGQSFIGVSGEMNERKALSVIVPVSERFDDVKTLYHEYKDTVEQYSKDFEFIYVLDGEFPEVQAALEELHNANEPVRVYKLSKWFGEATALSVAFEKAGGEKLLTLPAYYQVEAPEILKLLNALDDTDMAIAWRWPRKDSAFNQFQAKIFNSIFDAVTDVDYHDLGCGVRAFKRDVAKEIPVYGDQHRFLPVLANRRGFKVKEVQLEQSEKDSRTRVYRPGVYLRRLLDILTVFFLAKFTKKPLRFFGLIGSGTFVLGGLMLLYLAFERIFLGASIADRPLLLLGSLLFVLGIQIFAIGLIGELIIFTHAKEIKEYTVEEIVG
jgi:glycosyltransferase involved in cell wall biosynthesis